MKESERKEKLRRFYRNLCLSFVRSLRSLSLYPPEHPETEKNIGDFFRRLDKYLLQRPSLSFIFMRKEVAVENIRLPELSTGLGQVINRLQAMDLQRLMFRRGLTRAELLLFLQFLLPLLKKSQEAELVLAKNQERFPHILAGRLPFDETLETSHEDLSSTLRIARETVLSFSTQLKDLFADLHGPLSEPKVASAKETTEEIYDMVMGGEFLLKMVISRRSPDPDPHTHAINVSTLGMALAQKLGVENALIKEIGLGALLHDIGLYLSPSTSLSETVVVTLDEKKRRWEHPIRGAEILLASPGIPDLVPIVAFEHHLQYDGGGYPRQDRERNLNMASMITSITNAYDNLRRNTPEQEALSLTDALNWMDRRLAVDFHPLLLKKFRELVKGQATEEVESRSGSHSLGPISRPRSSR